MFSSTSPWIHCCQDWQLAHGRSWETIGPQRGAFIVVSMGNLRHWRPRTKSSRSHFSLWSHWIIFWWKRRSRWGKDRSRVNNSNSNSNCNFFSKDHPRAFIFGIGTPCLWNEGFWKGAKVFFSFHFIFWSLTIIVVRRKGWKPGKTTAMSFQHLLPAWTKFRVSYHYHNCFVWLWVGIFQINIFVIITIIHWPKLNFQTQKKLI